MNAPEWNGWDETTDERAATRDEEGREIPWAALEAEGTEGMRAEAAMGYGVDCRCEPQPHWGKLPSPYGADYVRWAVHFHHEDGCPRMKLLMADLN